MVFGAGLARPFGQVSGQAPADSVTTASQSGPVPVDGQVARLDSVGRHRVLADTTRADTSAQAAPAVPGQPADTATDSFLDDILSGTNKDSVVFDVKKNKVYIYQEGDIKYVGNNLKADYMEVDMETRQI